MIEMKSHDPAATVTMLERAKRILELTHHDWRLHEGPRRGGQAGRAQAKRAGGGYDHGFAVDGKREAHASPYQYAHY